MYDDDDHFMVTYSGPAMCNFCDSRVSLTIYLNMITEAQLMVTNHGRHGAHHSHGHATITITLIATALMTMVAMILLPCVMVEGKGAKEVEVVYNRFSSEARAAREKEMQKQKVSYIHIHIHPHFLITRVTGISPCNDQITERMQFHR